MIVSPEIDLTAREDSELAERLESFKKSLSEEQIKALVKETAELKAYQEEPSAKEIWRRSLCLAEKISNASQNHFPNKGKRGRNGTKVIHSSQCLLPVLPISNCCLI